MAVAKKPSFIDSDVWSFVLINWPILENNSQSHEGNDEAHHQ